jgi:hypothetical protein
MDASVTTADDVSSLDSLPAVGVREWISGARPVVGAIAASALMLLACSWFALSSGALGLRRDVGRPAPVRIGGTTPQRFGNAASPAPSAVLPRHVNGAARRQHRNGAAPATRHTRQSESGPQPDAPATPAPGSSPATPAASHAGPKSPAGPTQPPVTPSPPPEVNLPAPLDNPPSIPLPPIAPPLSVPDVPLPAAVSTVTTILGVP